MLASKRRNALESTRPLLWHIPFRGPQGKSPTSSAMSDPFATPIPQGFASPIPDSNSHTPFTPPCPRNLFDYSELNASPRDSRQKSDVVVVAAQQSTSGGQLFGRLSEDVIVLIMSCLRAYDLGALQQTCKAFADPELTDRVVKYVSGGIYPKSLTAGFTTAQIGGTTAASSRGSLLNFKNMRDMEMLVVARVLSRPEPQEGFWVSKAWCKSALKWLEATTKAWRALRKLYPESSSIPTTKSECVDCLRDKLEGKRMQEKKKEEDMKERKKVLSVQMVREVYRRTKGFPESALRARATTPYALPAFKSTTGVPLNFCSPCSSTPTGVAELEGHMMDMKVSMGYGQQQRGLPAPSPPRAMRAGKAPADNKWPTLEQAATRAAAAGKLKTKPAAGGMMAPLFLTPSKVLPPPPKLKMATLPAPVTAPPAHPRATDNYAAPPLKDGAYKLLPRSYLHAWRHYIRTGADKPDLEDNYLRLLLCEPHGKVVVPRHLSEWLEGQAEGLWGEGEEMDARNDVVVEVLTEREFEAFLEQEGGKAKTSGWMEYRVGFEVRKGGVGWGQQCCGKCMVKGVGGGEQK
ncbi:hypothetical protein TrRE_jg6246 [Triparma retinervis]|uniref:F-box domain-containing protein n=1 Tax=Triparma retinervis TaxID=2557542 RepID=A0A9W7C6E6_9STRA|nr:hypothetical protein TrRE_jg6246 [Triparma retinervis]